MDLVCVLFWQQFCVSTFQLVQSHSYFPILSHDSSLEADWFSHLSQECTISNSCVFSECFKPMHSTGCQGTTQ